jgi:hypothetical protein
MHLLNTKKSSLLTVVSFTTISLFLTTGCASLSSFKTAKPLGKGNTEGAFSVSHVATTNNQDSLIPGLMEKPPEFWFFELQGSMGITEKLDVGLKYTFPLSGSLDAKYCLAGADKDKGFFFSPGLKIGYTSLPDDASDSTNNNRIEYFVPLYLSMYFTDFLSLSLIPSYSGRFYTEASGYSNLLGGSANIRIGKKFGMIAEYSYYHNFNMEWDEYQIGAALYFPLFKLFK